MKMKVPRHVKHSGLKKGGFTLGEGSSRDKKKCGALINGRGKENVAGAGRDKSAIKIYVDQPVKVGKRPRKGF